VSPELPQVSVVMPVRNEERYIERSLGSVLAQDYPADRMEILIADGMSDDATRERIAEIADGRQVRILDNPQGIVAPGLNALIAEAQGEIVVRVDGHCEIASDYVRRAVEVLTGDEGYAGVGGPIETVGETDVARAVAAGMSSWFGVGGSAFRVGSARPIVADTVPFPAYPRAVLIEAGPYDEELVRNQDDEYNYRLRGAGKKLLLTPAMQSRYWSRANLRSLWRQYFQYGFWKVRVMQKHPRQMSWRQFAPPGLVAALVVGALGAVWSGGVRLGLAALVAVYVAAAVAAAIPVGRRLSWRGRVLLPFIFAILHLAYGSGFLVGGVRFVGRWRDP
jgi:succinoglycan biosynthesis protein ExoA